MAVGILKAHLRRAGIPAPDHVWLTQPNDDRFPHKCPKCGGAAYIGLNVVEHQGAPCR